MAKQKTSKAKTKDRKPAVEEARSKGLDKPPRKTRAPSPGASASEEGSGDATRVKRGKVAKPAKAEGAKKPTRARKDGGVQEKAEAKKPARARKDDGVQEKAEAKKPARARKDEGGQKKARAKARTDESAPSPAVPKGRKKKPKPTKGRAKDEEAVVSLEDVRRRVKARAAGKAEPEGSEEERAEASVAQGDEEAASLAAVAESDADASEAPPPSSSRASLREPDEASVEVELSDEEENRRYLRGLLEALLFASDRPLSVRELARAAKLDRPGAQSLLDELVRESASRGVILVQVAGGWAMRSNPLYSDYVQKLLQLRPVRLSRAQLETLAIIAYRQPITRPEVDEIRGVDSGPVLKGLMERDLIRILGKKEEAGRPMLYGTSPVFLELFNLESLNDLPSLKEFTELTEESRQAFAAEIGEEAPQGTIELSEEVERDLAPREVPDPDAVVESRDAEGGEAADAAGAPQSDDAESEPPTLETGGSDADETDADGSDDAGEPEPDDADPAETQRDESDEAAPDSDDEDSDDEDSDDEDSDDDDSDDDDSDDDDSDDDDSDDDEVSDDEGALPDGPPSEALASRPLGDLLGPDDEED